jgi:hypothetical protein
MGNSVANNTQQTDCFSSNQTDTDRFPSQVFLEEKEEVEDECSFVPFSVNRDFTQIRLSVTFIPYKRSTFLDGNTFSLSVPIWLAIRCLLI